MKMQVVIVSRPEMTKSGEAEADPLEPIVVVDVPDVDAATNQPIPNAGDQSETDDYEGFLDLGFMQQAVVYDVSLNIIYPSSCFEGEFSQEVPQGTNSDIDPDEGIYLNPRKMKDSFSGGAINHEARSSSAAGDTSAPPQKKKRLIFYLNELA